MLLVTAFLASILALVYVKLSRNVIMLRREHKISLGAGKSKDLEKAIRAQANFNEYVPIGLILIACLEINNFNQVITFASGLLLVIGRFMHAKSFLKDEMEVVLRVNGMKCTFWSLRILAGLNIFAIIMAFI
mgnify:FL=1